LKRKNNIRKIIQIIFFLLIGIVAAAELMPLHALCPFGGVVTLYSLITQGTLIQKIHMSSIVLMSLIFLLSILFGPVFCGWVCPLGSVQEWIGELGKKIFPKRYNLFIPSKIDRGLSFLRIFVLVVVVYITAKAGYLIFSSIDPYYALFNFWSEDVRLPSLIIFGVILVSSLFVSRPWCRYLCPYGALLGFFNKIRIFKISRNLSTCIHCRKCDKVCPVRIKISDKKNVTNLQCITCFECTSEMYCPVEHTVNLQAGSNGSYKEPKVAYLMKIKRSVMAILLIVIIFGGIALTMAMDIWSTKNDRNYFQDSTGQSEGYIKGSTTLQQLLNIGITEE